MKKKERGEPAENLRVVKRNMRYTTMFMILSAMLCVLGIKSFTSSGMSELPLVAITGILMFSYYLKTFLKQKGYIRQLEEKINVQTEEAVETPSSEVIDVKLPKEEDEDIDKPQE